MYFSPLIQDGEYMKRYKVGDYLMHERSGVCKVCDISEEALDGKGSEKLYYSLQPVFEKSSKVLTPVDSKVRMRDVMTREETEELLSKGPSLPFIREKNPRAAAEIFKEKIETFDLYDLATVVKTIYLRKQLRLALGKKTMSSDEKIMASSGKRLFEEMAFARKEEVSMTENTFYLALKKEKDLFLQEITE